MANFGELVIDAFNGLTPDINGIYESAKFYQLDDWQALQSTLVTGSGAAAIVFLMNRMSVCSYGIGAIMGHDRGAGNILEDEDFTVILAKWAGDENLNNAVVGKAAADLAAKVGEKIAAEKLAELMGKSAGILIGKKLGGKIGVKIGAKFGAKIGGKAAAGFIPFLGAAVGGGINLYFITSISSEARSWYRLKLSHH